MGRRRLGALLLVPRQWVRLPGTEFEVYLKGKAEMLGRGTECAVLPISRVPDDGGAPGPFGGWQLPIGSVYVRRGIDEWRADSAMRGPLTKGRN